MKKDKATKTTIYLDKDIYMKFKIYATTLNKSVSSLIEEHMREVLKGIEKENK